MGAIGGSAGVSRAPVASVRSRWTIGAFALLLPLPLFLLVSYGIPFLGVVSWSVTLPEPGLANYVQLTTDPSVQRVLLRTFRICVAVTLVAVTAAYLLAYVYVRSSQRLRLLIELCVLLPFWISVLIRAFGWLALLRSNGFLNTWLMSLGAIDAPLMMVRNEIGVVIGMVHFMIPFAVFPIAASLRQLDERVLLAARGLGASRLRSFWTVLLPMTAPGILGATLIVFVFALGFFITPAILGGGRAVMAAEYAYLQMFQTAQWGLGAALAVVLIAVVAILVALLLRVIRIEKLAG